MKTMNTTTTSGKQRADFSECEIGDYVLANDHDSGYVGESGASLSWPTIGATMHGKRFHLQRIVIPEIDKAYATAVWRRVK